MPLSDSFLRAADARVLVAGNLSATFLPARGMLGASFCQEGEELLGRVENLEASAGQGSTAGIPLLYPWANRLAALRYRAAGRDVLLDAHSSLLHFDEHGLPIHGVPWARLAWEVTATSASTLTARLEWTREDLLAIFPFPHRVELAVTLGEEGLTLETTVLANRGESVPVSFGFHPYFSLSGLARSDWRLSLPPLRRWVLDARGIPTGEETPFAGYDGPLGARSFDDGFSLSLPSQALSVSGGQRHLSVELVSGFRCAQVFAPRDKRYLALEPMTAPTAALGDGRGLETVKAGGKFQATFRIRTGGR